MDVAKAATAEIGKVPRNADFLTGINGPTVQLMPSELDSRSLIDNPYTSEPLAEIVEIVRDERLHLARDIADALKVSIRSIYRDIEMLVASGVSIEGERGVRV